LGEAKPGLPSTSANLSVHRDGDAISRSVLQQCDVKKLTSAVVACHDTNNSAGRTEVRIGYDAVGNRVRIEIDIAAGNVNQQA